MLTVTSLRKAVPGGRVLFQDLNLTVGNGQFVAITGESGVGKSTLLNLLAGLDRADAGSVVIDGTALEPLQDDELTRLRRDRIGFVFQAFHVLPHLDLAHNVALPLVLQKVDAHEALARAIGMLEAIGLGGRGADYPRQLSGGELQRVAIARALIHRPGLILADEPTGNLDPETAAKVMALFVDQVREAGASVVLVTHSPASAAVADRVLHLTRDGLVEHG
jgi:putative ABC transport system ATP-binding protein